MIEFLKAWAWLLIPAGLMLIFCFFGESKAFAKIADKAIAKIGGTK